MIVLPPGRLSTTIDWFQRSESRIAAKRAIGSVLPPGGYGTMKRIGFVGYACPEPVEAAGCADAALAKPSEAMRTVRASALQNLNIHLLQFCKANGRRSVVGRLQDAVRGTVAAKPLLRMDRQLVGAPQVEESRL